MEQMHWLKWTWTKTALRFNWIPIIKWKIDAMENEDPFVSVINIDATIKTIWHALMSAMIWTNNKIIGN